MAVLAVHKFTDLFSHDLSRSILQRRSSKTKFDAINSKTTDLLPKSHCTFLFETFLSIESCLKNVAPAGLPELFYQPLTSLLLITSSVGSKVPPMYPEIFSLGDRNGHLSSFDDAFLTRISGPFYWKTSDCSFVISEFLYSTQSLEASLMPLWKCGFPQFRDLIPLAPLPERVDGAVFQCLHYA